MKSLLGIVCLAAVLASTVNAEETKSNWSWGGKTETQEPSGDIYVAEESAFVPLADNTNSTSTEDVIDNILVSNRQGRNIEGFEEVYQDPNVKQALESGDDTQARNIIKDRLCNLGLMQCDDSISPKRPYVAPEDLIYAQPVDIQPVGRPIPSIPVRGPPRAYGPPKPLAPNYIPPRKVGYTGPYRPGYVAPSKYGPPGPPTSGIYGSSGFSSSFSNSYENQGPVYLSKPPGPIYDGGEEIPYEFDRPIKPGYVKDSKQSIIGSASSLSGELSSVQHIHHHYHHGEDKLKQPTVIVNNPVPIGAESHIHSSSSSNGYQTNGFTPIGTGLGASGGLYNNVKPVYESSGSGYSGVYKGSQNQAGVYNLGYASGSSYAPSASASNTYSTGPNSFGSTVGAYGSSNQFYKKELNTSPVNNNQLGTGSAYANQYSNQYSNQYAYKGQESGRAENYDCVCVPFDQCPSQDVIGRKDDLFLPIDPRNLKKDIEALPDDKVVVTDGNGTMTIIRVPKMVNADNATEESAEPKKIAKRETNDKASDSANKANIAPRQSGSYDDDSRGLFGKKIQPTFGVSFGLPNSGYGGYPLNPYGPNPIVNPYGSSIGGNGLNLGLVNVDPLVSVQVTKNDHGEKVIKPLVNLHVTPNNKLVHKIGSYLNHKKELFFHKPFFGGGGGGGFGHYPPHNIHSHYHYGPYRPPRPQFGPHYGPPPPHYGPPSHFAPRPPHFHGFHEGYSQGGFREANDYEEFSPSAEGPYINDAEDAGGLLSNEGFYYGRSVNENNGNVQSPNANYAQNYAYDRFQNSPNPDGGQSVKFPSNRRRRDTYESDKNATDESISRSKAEKRQAYFGNSIQQCGPRHVCCKRPYRPQIPQLQQQVQNRGQCGSRHSQGINGRIKNPVYVDGDSEFGEYPWQVAILKKDPKESVYVCGGTLIDHLHIVTAAHCVKTYTGFDLRVRLGEWDVNHDVEFYPYIERDVVSVHVHPQYYAGTLDNDLAILKLDHPVDWTKYPHISPACLPDKFSDFTGARCWTTGWGKDAFGDFGKYQNILKEVDVPVISHQQCESQLRQTRLGYQYQLNPGFVCAGGEEGKDACKGDGGGPMVCERGGSWQLVGVVSWGIGCGQVNVPGVYVKVSHYLDWIGQITGKY